MENIAVRPNGNLLVTLVNKPELWEVSPCAQKESSQTRLIHHFTGEEQATGITELSSDVFAIITPNTVWKMNLNNAGNYTPECIATSHWDS